MNVVAVKQSASKYTMRQAKDIAKFGKKSVLRADKTTEAIAEVYTPFRRLSKKPCTLSDNQYFIDKFEKTTQRELPKQDMWDSLSEEEKIDYIVKGRYRRLLANKIMNIIKKEPVEHFFMLSENGEILVYKKGNNYSVNIDMAIKLSEDLFQKRIALEQKRNTKFPHIESEVATTTVHNHPSSYGEILANHCSNGVVDIFKKFFGIKPEIEVNAPSVNDILTGSGQVLDGFVVDSLGHKFYFTPKSLDIKTVEDYEKYSYIMNKFEYLAEKTKNDVKLLYEEEKDNLETLMARGISSQEQIQEQRAVLLKAYANWLRELLSQKEYRKFLQSDFVKNNVGHYKEIT